jgi:ABC-type Mn2+/Zn2+ transport system permease subunit
MSFWEASFLWREPMLAALVGAGVLGYLGFFVVLRRVAFMSAALSQVSGLGVAMAFFVGSFFGVSPHDETALWLSPATFALAFALLGAAAFTLPARSRRVAPESVVALAYLVSSALVVVVLNSPRIAQEAHEIGDLLFGNAVVVQREHLVQLCVAATLVLVVHVFFFKDFLFTSFDHETARSVGLPVRALDLGLHATLAISVAVCTRALGALPAFAFLVLPAGAALLFSQRLKVVLVLSVVLSMVSAAVGYYLSWTWSLPTGPVMVALAAAFWLLGGLKRLLEGTP